MHIPAYLISLIGRQKLPAGRMPGGLLGDASGKIIDLHGKKSQEVNSGHGWPWALGSFAWPSLCAYCLCDPCLALAWSFPMVEATGMYMSDRMGFVG